MMGLGLLEIIIIGLVVYGIVQLCSNPPKFLAENLMTILAVGVTISAVVGVGLVMLLRFVPHSEPAPVSMRAYNSASTSTPGAIEPAVPASATTTHEPQLDALPSIWVLLLSLGTLAGTLAVAVFGSGNMRKVAVFASCLFVVALLFFGSWTATRRQSEMAAYNSEEHQIATRQTFLKEAEMPAKPPITVKTSAVEGTLDPKQPLSVLDIHYTRSGESRAEQEQLPVWVAGQTANDAEPSRIVIASDRFATREEALASIIPQAQQLIAERVVAEHRQTIPEVPHLSTDQLLGTVIKKRCDVTYPLQVGGFQEEVYKIYLEINVDQEAQEAVYALWKPQEVQKRLTYLGIGVGTITLLLGTGAFLTRRRDS